MDQSMVSTKNERINWVHSIPFIAMHLAPFAAFLTGVRWTDFAVCIALYYARMFFISAGFHRYFAHRSYELGRVMQFVMAFGGTTAAQKGPLWWAANHRHHHRYSDQPEDLHSPLRGFFWSHMGWFLSAKYKATMSDSIKDFTKYPELRWLDRHPLVPPTILALACFFIGGPSTLVIGFFLSTVLLYHGTFCVNSLAHLVGSRRYVTKDSSRNSLPLALITMGEGHHNNHHYFQSSVKQGFFWWEIDLSYYVLQLFRLLRLARNLRMPPIQILKRNRIKDGHFDIGMFHVHWTKASAVLAKAGQKQLDYYEAKKAAMREFLDNARKAAEEMNRMRANKPGV